VSFMAMVEAYGVAGQKPAHNSRNRGFPRPEEDMCVILEQAPCVTGSAGTGENLLQPIQKIVPSLSSKKIF
jgi:hypothetical protein